MTGTDGTIITLVLCAAALGFLWAKDSGKLQRIYDWVSSLKRDLSENYVPDVLRKDSKADGENGVSENEADHGAS